MRKKIVAILLAVCLAVGCLPVPASAAQLTGSREELKEFLNCYLLGNGYFPFDAEKALIPGWTYGSGTNALYYLLDWHPYDDSIYPGENSQLVEPYIDPGDSFDWGSDWSTIPKNPDFVPDPLGRFSDETINDYYVKTNEAKFEWVMENIFNISKDDIARLKSEFDTEYCYCYGGYIYSTGLRFGGSGPFGLAISNINEKGNLFYVTCDINDFEYTKAYFIVEPKTIGGNVYWTLHYAARHDEDFDLPDEFNYEMPAFPPNILNGGKCGEDSSWTLDNSSVLAISGQGEIAEGFFMFGGMESVIIDEGITDIESGAFECNKLNSITIPTSITHIGRWAFGECDSLADVYYNGTEEQWNKISIGEANEPLLNATIHFTGQTEARPGRKFCVKGDKL